MVFVFFFGSGLYGKVDDAAGLFHIATKFGHFFFAPLIPLESYIVLSEQGDHFTGVPIPLNGKSIFAAWGRAFSLGAVVLGAMGVAMTANPRYQHYGIPLLVVGGLGVALAAFLWFYKGVTRASFEWACAVGEQIGLSDREMARIYRAYGKPIPAHFDLSEPPPPPLPAPSAPYGWNTQYGPPQGFPMYPAFPAAPYPAVPAAPPGPAPTGVQPAIPVAPVPVEAPFYVTGINRATGEAGCFTVWADSPDAACAIAQQSGIDVQVVDDAGPR